jgi:hypothetical protein
MDDACDELPSVSLQSVKWNIDKEVSTVMLLRNTFGISSCQVQRF